MPLTHYCIVRRDLPFGVICAQLTHAAGESFYRLPQFSTGSQYSTHTIAVVLGARNETKLLKLEDWLKEDDVPHVAIREPDAPWYNQLMAIGLVPAQRETVQKYVKYFQTIRHVQEKLF